MATESRGSEKVFVAIIQDRHLDSEVAVFRDKSKAIAFAREQMHKQLAHPAGAEEQYHSEDFAAAHGEIWRMEYRFEADYAAVIETEIE